jgi:hypothetical protein
LSKTAHFSRSAVFSGPLSPESADNLSKLFAQGLIGDRRRGIQLTDDKVPNDRLELCVVVSSSATEGPSLVPPAPEPENHGPNHRRCAEEYGPDEKNETDSHGWGYTGCRGPET